MQIRAELLQELLLLQQVRPGPPPPPQLLRLEPLSADPFRIVQKFFANKQDKLNNNFNIPDNVDS